MAQATTANCTLLRFFLHFSRMDDADMQKVYFVREPNFSLKNVWTNYLGIGSKFKFVKVNITGCFGYEYSKIGIHINLVCQYQSKILTNCLESFDF